MGRPKLLNPKRWNLTQIKRRCGVTDYEECWEWPTEAKTAHAKRYVCIKHNGKVMLARRLAYQLKRKVDQENNRQAKLGKGNHHKVVKLPPPSRSNKLVPRCQNPYCINPLHQDALTESQKCKLAAQRGAYSNPVRAYKIALAKRAIGKLPGGMETARRIRESKDIGEVEAAKHGVSKALVNNIRANKCWKEYTNNPFAQLGARP